MKNLFIRDDDLTKQFCLAIAFAAVAAKLILARLQYATIYPPLAPLDDDLMFCRAVSITKGEWLGRYNQLTLSKHMFFRLWLAFLHVLKVPYLVGNMALWAIACRLAVAAFAPFIERNWHKLFIFLLLLFNPAASASYATRVYRDSVFPAFCFIFFSCCAAMAVRVYLKQGKITGWAILQGFAFGRIYLSREDGIWVLPFSVAATVITVGLMIIFKGKETGEKAKKFDITGYIALTFGSYIISLAMIFGYCYMNYLYYGRFIISDFSQGEFKDAYGAMTSLEQDNWHPMVAVPEDVREDLYREIEMFAPVKEALAVPLIENGYMNEAIGDYESGAFYWAMRQALANLGVYESPQSAKEYFETLTREIQAAVDSGRLKTQSGTNKLRSSLTPPIRKEYVLPVIEETFNGIELVLTFSQRDPLAGRAVGTTEEIQPVEEFIYQKGAVALIENTQIPYLSPIRAVAHRVLRLIRAVYRVIIPVMFIIRLIWQIKTLISDILEKRFTQRGYLNIIAFGLVGMAFLRRAMIAFVEVCAFGIGTYIMYLATAHPLIILYSGLGFVKTFEQ